MDTNNKKKRILIFSLVYYPRIVGGAEIAIKEITDRLGNKYDFDMITLRKGDSLFERVGNIDVYRVGFGWKQNEKNILSKIKVYKYLFPFFAYIKARKLNKDKKYDLTWSMMANYAGFGALFFKLNNKKTPFLLTLQEGDSISHIKSRVWFVYPLFKMIFTRADRIQAISKFLADFGKSMGYKGEIDIVPNGVDLNVFTKEVSVYEKDLLKQRLGKKEGDIFLVTTSRLVYKNAVDDIISALVKLPENVSLLVLGVGEEDVKLQKLSESLGVENRVKFLGFIDYKEIPKYFSVSDIFVRPSRSEGFGNSFIEAMASKLPVIATPVGGIVDFLDDKETGVFCAPNNPQSISNAVKQILQDEKLKNHIIDRGFSRVNERYSWDKVTNEMNTVFDKVS